MAQSASIKAIDTFVDLSKAGFRPLDAAKPRHFAAIGRFLKAVSNHIDIPLSTCLQMQIDPSEEGITRIIAGNMAVGDIMAAIRRIALMRVSNAAVVPQINTLFTEISVLREHRNNVVHDAFMVSGNKMAFHNANIARTAGSIDVNIYTIDEIGQFTAYAKRLGYRISAITGQLIPEYDHLLKQVVLLQILHHLQMTIVLALIKTGKISDPEKARFKEMNKVAKENFDRFVVATQGIDPDYADIKKAAAASTRELSLFISQLNAPAGEALLEIPPRLQKKDQKRQAGAPPKSPRPPRSSRA